MNYIKLFFAVVFCASLYAQTETTEMRKNENLSSFQWEEGDRIDAARINAIAKLTCNRGGFIFTEVSDIRESNGALVFRPQNTILLIEYGTKKLQISSPIIYGRRNHRWIAISDPSDVCHTLFAFELDRDSLLKSIKEMTPENTSDDQFLWVSFGVEIYLLDKQSNKPIKQGTLFTEKLKIKLSQDSIEVVAFNNLGVTIPTDTSAKKFSLFPKLPQLDE